MQCIIRGPLGEIFQDFYASFSCQRPQTASASGNSGIASENGYFSSCAGFFLLLRDGAERDYRAFQIWERPVVFEPLDLAFLEPDLVDRIVTSTNLDQSAALGTGEVALITSSTEGSGACSKRANRPDLRCKSRVA